ncbi:beta-lactamase-like protein [Paraphoma chrysanthemicola]|uniref:Beta-lactamase-like protein n=1 Tax=Paraphoma chrysanthemicola TaxID=798071 RepID=A0A8K0RJM1_9PLEO|nr:beta-lactamase-like protein [Paraphoma chrysanthemicola]
MSAAPNLPWHPIPSSQSTCKVHLIQAGGLYIPTDMALLPGPNEPNDSANKNAPKSDSKSSSYYAPDYVFLISHTATNTTYIFDLGMRKDLDALPPLLKENVLPQFRCEPQSPCEILQKHGSAEQQPEHVKAVIFSHMHFDHVGDGAKAGFGDAELWVGPTCCTYARPGYPIDEKGATLTETLPTDGSRKIIEAYIPDDVLREAGDSRAGKVLAAMKKGLYNGTELKKADWQPIGAFERGHDVFGDGAAYLIDAPGHSAGHQMLLVRTTTAPDSFVLLAGDSFHHPAILDEPLRTARPPYSKTGMHGEPDIAIETIWRARKMAEQEEVWVIAAHDFSVGNALVEGKKEVEGLVEINEWKEKGWKRNMEKGFVSSL